MKDFYICDCVRQENKVITSTFVVVGKQIKPKKSGEPYLALTLGDRSGQLEAKMWDNVEEVLEAFEQDDFLKIKGLINKYKNRFQLTVHKPVSYTHLFLGRQGNFPTIPEQGGCREGRIGSCGIHQTPLRSPRGQAIDGRMSTLAVREPWTGAELGQVILADEAQAEEATVAAVQAFARLQALTTYERKALLARIAREIEGRQEEFAGLLAREAGKPIAICLLYTSRCV